MSFGDPTEIKDVPCSRCGSFVSEDELYDLDWDWVYVANATMMIPKRKSNNY